MRRDRDLEYQPPPEHACVVDEGPIDLGVDPDSGERHVLHRKVHYYRGAVVWFSLQQTLAESNGTRHIITRVDCCDGEVHRHVFARGKGEVDRISLVTIPKLGHTVVDREFDRYINEMLSSWEARVRAWRS